MQHQDAGDFWCILEDISVPDMEARRGPKEEWGTTKGKKRRVKNLTDGSENPLGEWNSMTIEALGDVVCQVRGFHRIHSPLLVTKKPTSISTACRSSSGCNRSCCLTPDRLR